MGRGLKKYVELSSYGNVSAQCSYADIRICLWRFDPTTSRFVCCPETTLFMQPLTLYIKKKKKKKETINGGSRTDKKTSPP